MFAEYLKEKDGLEVVQSTGGFFSYRVVGDQFYFADFFVSQEHRKSPRHFFELMLKARELARAADCKRFTCHVPLNILSLNEVLISRLKFGFKVLGQQGDALALELPLTEADKWDRQ